MHDLTTILKQMEQRVLDDSMQFVELEDILDVRELTAFHVRLSLRVVQDISQTKKDRQESLLLSHQCPMAYFVAAALYHEKTSVACCISTAIICRNLNCLTEGQRLVLEREFPTETHDGLFATLF